MIIEIRDDKKIEEVCNEFSRCYPFLKIEFYYKPHGWQEASSSKDLVAREKSIGELRTNGHEGLIEIHYWQKAGNVEHQFYSRFGLNVQVFRKQNDIWVQTLGTDELSLEDQNEAGRKQSEESLHGTNRKLNQ